MTIDDVRLLQAAVREIYCDALVQEWIVGLVEGDATPRGARRRVGPRHARARARRAGRALLAGRAYVVPSDVEARLVPVLGHRLVFAPAFLAEVRRTGIQVALQRFFASLLERVPPPDSGSTRTEPGREHGASVFPLVPRRRLLGLAFGAVEKPAARPRVRHRRIASLRARRPGPVDRLEDVGTAATAHMPATSSSCSSATEESPCASSWSTAGPAWRCTATTRRGSASPVPSPPSLELVEASARAARGLLGYVDRASAADGVGFGARRETSLTPTRCTSACALRRSMPRRRHSTTRSSASASSAAICPPAASCSSSRTSSRRRRRRRGPPRCRAAGSWCRSSSRIRCGNRTSRPSRRSSCRSRTPGRVGSPSSASRGRRSRIAAAPIASGS